MQIIKQGDVVKLKEKVGQISFSGKVAAAKNQDVTVITERAVFKLGKEGLILTEIAPGVDLEEDILKQMEFKPIISKDLKEMDARIFKPGRMGIFDDVI